MGSLYCGGPGKTWDFVCCNSKNPFKIRNRLSFPVSWLPLHDLELLTVILWRLYRSCCHYKLFYPFCSLCRQLLGRYLLSGGKLSHTIKPKPWSLTTLLRARQVSLCCSKHQAQWKCKTFTKTHVLNCQTSSVLSFCGFGGLFIICLSLQ